MGADATAQAGARTRLLGSSLEDKSLKRKLPLDVERYYSETIAILHNLPEATHPVWATLKSRLDNINQSHRSKSALFEQLKAACVKEDLDWKGVDFISTACQHRPRMIRLEESAVLLYKLMGIHGKHWEYTNGSSLYSKALLRDEESADSIFLFLGLLEFIQSTTDDSMSYLNPTLQSKCQQMERLLQKKRGAPKIRQFMEIWDKTADNERDDESDDNGEEEEPPSQKRRCIKAENFE